MPNLSDAHTGRAINIYRAFLAMLLVLTCAGPAAAQDAYRLNTGDQIALRLVQWDAIRLGFIEFDAVNGTYAVTPDGTIMLPLIGNIDVAGKTLTEIADVTALAFQGRLGLIEPPGVSLSVVSYRPVYVLGAVASPGAYDFSPGLTVQQALALAGGVDSPFDVGPNGQAAVIRTSGTLEEIAIDVARQEVRAARLRAEMDGGRDFMAPNGVTHPEGTDALNAIVAHERALFQSRGEAKTRALDALNDSRALLETEISALEEKLSGLTRQVNLLRKEVGNMEALFERGLVRSPNLVSLQSQLINLESRQLDTETAVFRARQSIGELERERIDIEANRRLEVLRELQRSEALIEQFTARQSMNRRLLLGAEALLVATGQETDIQISFRVIRQGTDGPQILDAAPNTRLGPADVIEVVATQDTGD